MRTDEELLDEIENANNGEGPDFNAAVSDPALVAIAVANLEVRAAEANLDRKVAAAREAGHTWQEIGDILGLTRQGALKRYRAA